MLPREDDNLGPLTCVASPQAIKLGKLFNIGVKEYFTAQSIIMEPANQSVLSSCPSCPWYYRFYGRLKPCNLYPIYGVQMTFHLRYDLNISLSGRLNKMSRPFCYARVRNKTGKRTDLDQPLFNQAGKLQT